MIIAPAHGCAWSILIIIITQANNITISEYNQILRRSHNGNSLLSCQNGKNKNDLFVEKKSKRNNNKNVYFEKNTQ